MPSEVQDYENIFRAVLTVHWDKVNRRVNSRIFKGVELSVSLESIRNQEETIAIYLKELTNPPTSFVEGIAKINVGVLRGIGREGDQPVEYNVIPDPTITNPAHAYIPEKITKSKAKKIKDQLEVELIK